MEGENKEGTHRMTGASPEEPTPTRGALARAVGVAAGYGQAQAGADTSV